MNRFNSEGGVPRPEEFPLGSMESRAAARAMLEAQERGVRRVQIIHSIPRPNRTTQGRTSDIGSSEARVA